MFLVIFLCLVLSCVMPSAHDFYFFLRPFAACELSLSLYHHSHPQKAYARFLCAFRSPLSLQVYIYIYIPESACSSGSWRFVMGSPSGEELEGESPRGGERVTSLRKAPSNFGVNFQKNVVLKSLSKNSYGERELVSDFFEL